MFNMIPLNHYVLTKQHVVLNLNALTGNNQLRPDPLGYFCRNRDALAVDEPPQKQEGQDLGITD